MGDNRSVLSHRCEGLLKDKKSIRYDYPYKYFKREEDIGWWLFGMKCDSEYGDCYHMPYIKLNYCPYCGAKLTEQSIRTGE